MFYSGVCEILLCYYLLRDGFEVFMFGHMTELSMWFLWKKKKEE